MERSENTATYCKNTFIRVGFISRLSRRINAKCDPIWQKEADGEYREKGKKFSFFNIEERD
jgi:hypothetical protein